jgi:hypothetical protein
VEEVREISELDLNPVCHRDKDAGSSMRGFAWSRNADPHALCASTRILPLFENSRNVEMKRSASNTLL